VSANATFWNKLAEKYSRQPLADPAAFERKIEVTKGRMQPEHVVLDIGCGTGSLALRLAPAAAHVHGLDVSTEMARIASAKARAGAVANVSFHVGPFDDSFTTFGDASLDGVCAYSLLHLVEDRSLALQRIYRLLKPGGFFISSTVCLGDMRLLYAPLLAAMRWLGKAPYVSIFTKHTLEQDIRAAGFVDVGQPDVRAKANIAFVVAAKPS
jgi:arsenite methyltransferase